MYALIQTLKSWEQYLFEKEFILLTDHFSLKSLNLQKSISRMHGQWLRFIERFDFIIRHTKGNDNKVADALSRKGNLLSLGEIIAFDHIWDLYPTYLDFGKN